MKKMIPLCLCLTLLLIGACADAKMASDEEEVVLPSPVTVPTLIQGQEEVGNDRNPVDQDFTYPIKQPDTSINTVYPIVTQYTLPPGTTMGPDFRIDRPVKAESLTVTGVGPAGVPIILIDVSELGRVYGEVVIGESGKFEISIPEGLPHGHQIAIKLGDITGTDLNPLDFVYNPNYSDRYLLGVLFDIALIED